MRRFRGSFLLRSWEIGRAERFEVEHIQSGAAIAVPTLAAACEWIVCRQSEQIAAEQTEETAAELDHDATVPTSSEAGGGVRRGGGANPCPNGSTI